MICAYCGRYKAVDSFAGEGGIGVGLRRAGFCVTAVDTEASRLDLYPIDHCPGADRIIGDAIAYLYEHGREFAYAHASPTCTGYSRGTAALPGRLEKYDRLIPVVRDVLLELGIPYTIENVEDAGPELRDPLLLCWSMFYEAGSVRDADGLPLRMDRHRLFESNVPLVAPCPCDHDESVWCAGSYGGARRAKRFKGEPLTKVAPRDRHEARFVRKGGYVPRSLEVQRALLGTPWMSAKGCQLSIPPIYAEHIGTQLLAHVASERAA